MKQIIKGKLYDTDKAEYVISVKRDGICSVNLDIYKTQNGKYFAYDHLKPALINEDALKECLGECQTDLYIELFGKVEEG